MRRNVNVIYQNNPSISWWSNASFFDDEHHPSSISVDFLKFFFVNLNQLVIVPTVFVSPEFMMRLFQNYVHFHSTKKTIELESVLSSGYVRLILHFITFLTDRSVMFQLNANDIQNVDGFLKNLVIH